MPSDQERLSKSILDVLWSWTDGTPRTPCANLSIRNAPQLKSSKLLLVCQPSCTPTYRHNDHFSLDCFPIWGAPYVYRSFFQWYALYPALAGSLRGRDSRI